MWGEAEAFPLAEVGNDFCSSGGCEEEKAKEYIFPSAEAGGEINLKWDEAEAIQTAEAGNEVNSNIDKADAETFLQQRLGQGRGLLEFSSAEAGNSNVDTAEAETFSPA
jgi:hypothetical protein